MKWDLDLEAEDLHGVKPVQPVIHLPLQLVERAIIPIATIYSPQTISRPPYSLPLTPKSPTLTPLPQHPILINIIHPQTLANRACSKRASGLHHSCFGDAFLRGSGEGGPGEGELPDAAVETGVEGEADVWGEGEGG